jgi:hypothetical protein
MYTPGLSAQVLYSRLCLMFMYYLRTWHLRHLNDCMPDRHEIRTFYVFCVELRLGQYCGHLHFHDFV